jgi:PmbA protein
MSNIQTIIEKQLDLLKSEHRISEYSISKNRLEKANTYAEKQGKIESQLTAVREEYVIILYKSTSDVMYSSQTNISSLDSEQEIIENLLETVSLLEHGKSKSYPLPTPDMKEVDDSHIDYSLYAEQEIITAFKEKTIFDIHTNIITQLQEEISKYSNVVLNSFECFTTFETNELTISTGISKSDQKTSGYIETIISVKNQTEEVEHVVYQPISRFFSFDFQNHFKEEILKAIDKSKKKEISSFTGPIILSNKACLDFFTPDSTMGNPYIAHCLARFKDMGISKYEIGKQPIPIQEDALTIYSNALQYSNAESIPYTNEGISAQRTCLIKQGVVQSFIGNIQYTHYIGTKPTGPIGVIEIEQGSKTYDELTNEDSYLIIETFAWFSPDIVSGNFSAEIRLGYLVKHGEKTPFIGGLFTGNIFDCISNISLSKETMEEVGYIGPRHIKIKQGKYIGKE